MIWVYDVGNVREVMKLEAFFGYFWFEKLQIKTFFLEIPSPYCPYLGGLNGSTASVLIEYTCPAWIYGLINTAATVKIQFIKIIQDHYIIKNSIIIIEGLVGV